MVLHHILKALKTETTGALSIFLECLNCKMVDLNDYGFYGFLVIKKTTCKFLFQ